MAKSNNRDYIYLVWKDTKGSKNYIVGELSRNGKYEFKYSEEVNAAINNGFELLLAFDELDKTYTSDHLFGTFLSRLPDRKRRNIESILKKYSMDNYDEFELLKRSGAMLPIDNLSFIDPIIENLNENIEKEFYLSGIRHHAPCLSTCCTKIDYLKVGYSLKVRMEPKNIKDPKAVEVLDDKDGRLGYIPRYYAPYVFERLKQGQKYEIIITELNNEENNCDVCIKVKLQMFSNNRS